MNYRRLGKTNIKVSEISLGTWQVGGKWGSGFDDKSANNILREAIDEGINFIDTADVYESGMSEAAVGKAIKESSEEVFIATKCGRQINPHLNKNYTEKVLRKFVENSLRNTRMECLDLIQLHCPPPEVYYRPEIFGLFDRLKEEGKIKNLGVSVEKVEEGLKAIQFSNVSTIQIIFNIFRQRPAELFFAEAMKKDAGIIVRVPLASGLLTGRFSEDSDFGEADHRQANRDGQLFDKGETFSGVPFKVGLKAMDDIRKVFRSQGNLAPQALRWILDHPQVSCAIPGVSNPEHLASNLSAAYMDPLTSFERLAVNEIYEKQIKNHVHDLW